MYTALRPVWWFLESVGSAFFVPVLKRSMTKGDSNDLCHWDGEVVLKLVDRNGSIIKGETTWWDAHTQTQQEVKDGESDDELMRCEVNQIKSRSWC